MSPWREEELQRGRAHHPHCTVGVGKLGAGRAVGPQPGRQIKAAWGQGPWMGGTAHLGLCALQLPASPFPGHHLLFHLLPKPGCLGL